MTVAHPASQFFCPNVTQFFLLLDLHKVRPSWCVHQATLPLCSTAGGSNMLVWWNRRRRMRHCFFGCHWILLREYHKTCLCHCFGGGFILFILFVTGNVITRAFCINAGWQLSLILPVSVVVIFFDVTPYFWCLTIFSSPWPFFTLNSIFFVKTYWFDETEEFSIASDANGYYWGNVTRLWQVLRWKHECTCRRGRSSIAMTPFLFFWETELSRFSPAHTTTLMHPHGHKKIEQRVSRSRDSVRINQKWDLSLYGFCANMEVTQDEKSFLGRLLIMRKMFVE